ncbi:MAG: acyl-ACP--UDP-N-acetylglucosamine O-acyltransferase [Syntrophaceae bacterium]
MTKIDPSALVSPRSVIHDGVEIGPFSIIGDEVEIGAGTRIGPHCLVQGPTSIGSECTLTGYASIGGPPQDLKYKGEKTRLAIGDHNTIREFVTINRGTTHGGGITTIGSHNLFMAYTHVAHDCRLGDYIVMGNLATLAGHVEVQDHVILGGLCAAHQFTHIGAFAIIGGGSMISLDIVPYAKASGDRARIFGTNTIGLKRGGFSEEAIKTIAKAYKIVFKQGRTLKDALETLEAEYPAQPEIEHLTAFIRASSRGIAR